MYFVFYRTLDNLKYLSRTRGAGAKDKVIKIPTFTALVHEARKNKAQSARLLKILRPTTLYDKIEQAKQIIDNLDDDEAGPTVEKINLIVK